MKKAHMPDSHTAHPNVTPLIDIVMCLIIFYMLVAKIGVNLGQDQRGGQVLPEIGRRQPGTRGIAQPALDQAAAPETGHLRQRPDRGGRDEGNQ